MTGIVTEAMVEAVRAGTHELELRPRPRCRRRVWLMRHDPVIGSYAYMMTSCTIRWRLIGDRYERVGDQQLTDRPDVAEWLRRHPLCGIAARLVPVCDEVPF